MAASPKSETKINRTENQNKSANSQFLSDKMRSNEDQNDNTNNKNEEIRPNKYVTWRNDKRVYITTPYERFKRFGKELTEIFSDGESQVCQLMNPEITIVSKMRFEFDRTYETNAVDSDVIGRLVYVHQEIIKHLTNCNEKDLTCIVMNHVQAETDDKYFEEVYFQFPFIKAPVQNMLDRLLPNLKFFFNETGMHEHMSIIPNNAIDNILSGEIYETGLWPLPGSHICGNILTISHVFDYISRKQLKTTDEIKCYPPEAYFSNFQLPDNMDYAVSNSFYFTNLNGFDIIRKYSDIANEETQ